MTRPDPVAAALDLATRFHEAYERLAPSFGYETREETRTFDPESKTGRLMVAVCGEILRAANPPAGAERATEPVYTDDTPLMLEYREADEPATPAVGEEGDTELLALADVLALESHDSDPDAVYEAVATLAARLRALLADVARLQKELDGTTFREERYAEDAVGARLALEDARAEVARLTEERDNTTKALRRADSMLTAVRKIADDYHDVDVTGDPPREVACNPCANDILNALDGRTWPR